MSSYSARVSGSIVVAIPACNEAAHIARCLDALGHQIGRPIDEIVVLVNNSTDGTGDVARTARLDPATTLHVVEAILPPEQAHAGWARKLAMDAAARCIVGNGVLLTTDADGAADPDWLAGNLAAIEAGADVVAGWVDLDPSDWARIPLHLHEDDAREMAYDALCDEIHARLDPDPYDPLPRHTQHSGASIAVTIAAYRQSGGIPPLPCGEDRAFLGALRRIDAHIRHAWECHVTVSGRTEGRASGGMADTIRRRMVAQDATIDDRLEPAEDCVRRATARHRLRMCRAVPALVETFARDLHLDPVKLSRDLAQHPFGQVWSAVEGTSSILKRHPVALSDLATQTAHAVAICSRLRAQNSSNNMPVTSSMADAMDDKN